MDAVLAIDAAVHESMFAHMMIRDSTVWERTRPGLQPQWEQISRYRQTREFTRWRVGSNRR
jgi:hypothetical protein